MNYGNTYGNLNISFYGNGKHLNKSSRFSHKIYLQKLLCKKFYRSIEKSM